jgi:hypothetical protein
MNAKTNNPKPFRHNTTDAVKCLIEDFNQYLDGSCEPDGDSHQCSLDNALKIKETLKMVRVLGKAIEKGDPQTIADAWLRLKPKIAV